MINKYCRLHPLALMPANVLTTTFLTFFFVYSFILLISMIKQQALSCKLSLRGIISLEDLQGITVSFP